MEANADLTREITSNTEQTMEELQSQTERKSDDSCAEFYDLTVESPISSTKNSHQRKIHRLEDRRRSEKDKSPSRKSQRRGKGSRGQSQNLISTVRTWTKYDERIESFARYLTHSDSTTEDETSESSKISHFESNGRHWDYHRQREESKRKMNAPIYQPANCDSRERSRSRTRREIDPPIRCYDRTAERSKSRSRSRYRSKRSTERYRRNYSSDRGDEDRERFKRRSRSKKGDARNKRSKIRSPSKRRGSSPGIYRRRYSNESDEKGTQRSKSRSRSRSRRYKKFQRSSHESERIESNVKVEFNPESDVEYGLFTKLKSTVKSTIATSSNHYANTKCDSSSQSAEWQDFFDIDTESTDPSPNPNALPEYQDQNLVPMVTSDAQEQNVADISPVDGDRDPIKFNFTKTLKVDKLKVNDAFKRVTNKNFTELKCKLSTLLKSVLDEPGTSNKCQELDGTEDISIDTEIIQKLTAQPIQDTTDRLPKNLKFDFDKVKEAVTTAKMLESFQPQKDFSLYRPYCPVPVPKFECPTSPVSTSTPKPSLLSLLKLPIPSTRFLPRVPFQTPARPHYGHPVKSNHSDLQTNSNLNHRSSVYIEREQVPMTYGDHKRSKAASKGLDLNFEWKSFKIPKKSKRPATVVNDYGENYDIGQPTSSQSYDKPRSPPSVSLIDDSDDGEKYDIRQPTSSQSAEKTKSRTRVTLAYDNDATESYDFGQTTSSQFANKTKSRTRVTLVDKNDASENYDFGQPTSSNSTDIINNHLDHDIDSHLNKHTTDDLSDAVDNSSKEENMAATLKELMGTNQFATLVDIIKKITQDDTLVKLQKALTNCTTGIDTNEKDGQESPLPTEEDITEEPRRNSKIRKQKTPTTSNPTSGCQEGTSSTEKSKFKNIQLEWHSLRKVLTCQQCHKPHGNSMVSHYVNEHPGIEVLVSRLAPEAAECLRSGKDITDCKIIHPRGLTGYEYQQYCYFCNIYKRFTKKDWITHVARHTGYYELKCNHCSRMFAQKPCNLKCNKINDFKKISHPQFQARELKAYVCDLCNYVRFHENEIEMHLRNEHENGSNAYTDFIFLTFPYHGRKSYEERKPYKKRKPEEKKRKPYKKRKSRSESLDDFITMLETEYETDWNSDDESESETDWNSDDESECETDEVEKELNDLMDLSEPNEPQSDDEDGVKSEMESIHFDCDAPEADNEGNNNWEDGHSNGGSDSV